MGNQNLPLAQPPGSPVCVAPLLSTFFFLFSSLIPTPLKLSLFGRGCSQEGGYSPAELLFLHLGNSAENFL